MDGINTMRLIARIMNNKFTMTLLALSISGCSTTNQLQSVISGYGHLLKKEEAVEKNTKAQKEQPKKFSELKPSIQERLPKTIEPPRKAPSLEKPSELEKKKKEELKVSQDKPVSQPEAAQEPVGRSPRIPTKTIEEILRYKIEYRAPEKLKHPLQNSDKLYFMIGEDEHGSYLYAEGAVIEGAYNKFLKYVRHYKDRGINLNRFMMHSPGGLLNEGLAIGKYIRDNNWTTDADKSIKCYSSCGFIYASGITQRMKKGAEVGFHRPYYPGRGDTPELINQMYSDYLSYWELISGDINLYDTFMMNYDRNDMYILDKTNIKQYFSDIEIY